MVRRLTTVALGIEAVIFDWGGTLTRWHDIDFHAESLALAQAVVDAGTEDDRRARRPAAPRPVPRSGAAAATTSRARRSPTCSPRPGSSTTRSCSRRTTSSGSRTPRTDPEVGPLLDGAAGPRHQGRRAVQHDLAARWHEGFFAPRRRARPRSTATSTPARSRGPSRRREAFRAAMEAVGVDDPARCVYVGDRLFDDIWGAQNAGMRGDPRPAQRHPGTRASRRGHSERRAVTPSAARRSARSRRLLRGSRSVHCMNTNRVGRSTSRPGGSGEDSGTVPGNISGVPRNAS